MQQHILDVMLRILSNISKATLTDTSVYFWLKLNCKIIWGFEENQLNVSDRFELLTSICMFIHTHACTG